MMSRAEFERDLLCERVRRGIAAAKARGQTSRRKVSRLAYEERLSQRRIAERLGGSRTTVNEIFERSRSEGTGTAGG